MITSRKNPFVQRARAVREGRERGLIFVEGLRLCEEAEAAALDFEFVLYDAALEHDERAARLLSSLRRRCREVLAASREVIESASDTKTSQGVIAVARRPGFSNSPTHSPTQTTAHSSAHSPASSPPHLPPYSPSHSPGLQPASGLTPGITPGLIGRGVNPLVVVMHRVNNPSNAGAMLRVAEAAGATSVVATQGSTDLFSPKSLRGSMGSAFRLPVWAGPSYEEALSWCAENGVRTVATDLDARAAHTDLDWTVPRAVILGPEAGGLSPEEAGRADDAVRIPMREPVESLNVATALAVLLYEAARQRNFK